MMISRASSDSALAISTICRCAMRQLGHRRVGREVDAEALQQRLDLPRAAAAVSTSCSEPPATRLAADEDVGGDVEIVEQVEFLVDEGDAGRHRLA